MDVLAAAAELEAAGRSIVHMEVGQPGATGARAGASRRSGGAEGPPRLHRSARHPAAPRADRAPLPRRLWRRPVAGTRDGHHRLLGRLQPDLPRRLRCRRPHRHGLARLSRLPQHPEGAWPGGGRDRGRPRHALGADGRTCRGGARARRRLPACSSQAPPTRPAR